MGLRTHARPSPKLGILKGHDDDAPLAERADSPRKVLAVLLRDECVHDLRVLQDLEILVGDMRLRELREIVKSLQTSVRELVDRSGFEPLTSAVQRRRPFCQ